MSISVDYSYINDLKKILEQNTDKRVCVVGICQTPWTEEIGKIMDRLVRERVKIQAKQYLMKTEEQNEFILDFC